MRKLHLGLAALLVLTTAVFVGCGDDDDDDQGTPTGPAFTVGIASNPASPKTGEKVQITATPDPAGSYTYTWTASGGTLLQTTGNSVSWIAPDADGTIDVQVVANNGTDAIVAKKAIVVADYTPPVTPHFVGSQTCATCHAGIHDAWSSTGHASALASLTSIGMGNNDQCLACHTIGFDATVANGGYDEQRVARLANVGCENCHAPGSNHPSAEMPQLPTSLDGELCGTCHEGEHHPTFSEWASSGHATLLEDPAMVEEAQNRSCARCHNGLEARKYLDDPAGYTAPPANLEEVHNIACVVCHDPHGNDNLANLRNAVNDIALPDGTHPAAGAGRLCIACHNQRRTPANITQQIHAPSGRLGPHHSCQGDMLAGVGAYDSINVAFNFASSKHIQIQDGCVNCHNHHIPFEEGSAAYTGHEFKPIVEACQPCHGSLTSFTDITAKDDYDGDGNVEGLQLEVAGLLAVLEEKIIDATPADSTADREAIATAFAEPGYPNLATVLGSANYSTKDQRKATYNWMFVEFDQSHGVHNATYSIQLLQQSILYLDPLGLGRATVLVE